MIATLVQQTLYGAIDYFQFLICNISTIKKIGVGRVEKNNKILMVMFLSFVKILKFFITRRNVTISRIFFLTRKKN